MKRHFALLQLAVVLAAPSVAQEPYYGAYGNDYGYVPGYGYGDYPNPDYDNGSRQFNFDPGSAMRDMFGSSNPGYSGYPGYGYAPPAYPQAYGYPAYPDPALPYSGYGYRTQPPERYTPYEMPAPSAAPAETPRALLQPQYEQPYEPRAPVDYSPGFSSPDQAAQYRFRPLEAPSAADTNIPLPSEYPPPGDYAAPYPEPPPVSSYWEPAPVAPKRYDEAPSYWEPAPSAPAPASLPMTVDPNLKFRPLDKPGYSSDLEQQ